MASPHDSRHPTPPQHSPLSLGTDAEWNVNVHDASPLLGALAGRNDAWREDEYRYSSAAGSGISPFLNDEPLFSFNDSYSSDLSALNEPHNALGLELPPTDGFMNSPLMDHSYYDIPRMDSHMQRNGQLQINTDLHTSPMYLHSPQEHSPYNLSAVQPPLSAAASTPSSAGYPTVLRTPSALPPPHHLMLSTGNSSLLSPRTPYQYFQPHQLSPKSPLTSMTASPSLRSPSATYLDEEAYRMRPAPGNLPTVLDLAARFPGYGQIVPQRTYRPNTQSDRRRYVEEVNLEEPIMFYSLHGDTCGIPCVDALNSKFSNLHGRDDPMFVQRGPSVSIRLVWPGYAAWSRQIPTRDFRSPPQPITRSKLAKNVAKTIQRFIEDMKDKPLEEEADQRYRVGGRHITIGDIELVGLQHVSMGSWQAHIRLRRPS